MRRIKAVRTFTSRNNRELLPGETDFLHKLAARAAVARGDAVYDDSPVREKEAPISLEVEEDPAIPDLPKRYVLKRMKKGALLDLLDKRSPDHSLSLDDKKQALIDALIGE